MSTTTNFEEWLENIEEQADDKLEEINNLYETVSTGTNYGGFSYAENDGKIFITHDYLDEIETLMLASEKAKGHFLAILDKRHGGDLESVRATYDFRRAMEKND